MRINMFIFLSLLLSLSCFAEDSPQVSIGVQSDLAESVQVQSHDSRLSVLRKQADEQAKKSAESKDKSYVSMAPDSNNPDYWMQKNQEDSRIQQTRQNEMTEEERHAQTSALRKVLGQWQEHRSQKFFRTDFKNSQAGNHSSHHQHHGSSKNVNALVTSGTLWYATMLTGADSYIPGAVAAVIQEGPFSGAKAIGGFEVAPDGAHIILTFRELSYHNETYPISAVAVDPNTKITGVTGDIDHHIFRRYVAPVAAGFLQEVTDALKSEGSVVTNSSSAVISGPHLSNTQLAIMGGAGAANALARAVEPRGVLRLPEVKIAPNQDIGILVLKPIV